MNLKKKLSSTEWFVFLIVSGLLITLNAISIFKTHTVGVKFKKNIAAMKK